MNKIDLPTYDERRSEPRWAASGTASLLVSQPVRRTITGVLQDQSKSGFRLAHRDPDLEAGEKVEFFIDGSSGTAMVVWRRILEGHIECGFVIESPAV